MGGGHSFTTRGLRIIGFGLLGFAITILAGGICSALLVSNLDQVPEPDINLYVDTGTFQASHKIDAETLILLFLLNPRDSEGFRVENQSVVLNGLAHDFRRPLTLHRAAVRASFDFSQGIALLVAGEADVGNGSADKQTVSVCSFPSCLTILLKL